MEKVKSKVKVGIETPFLILEDEIVTMDKKKIYSPIEKTLKEEILKEAHESKFIIHLGSTKIHRDLKDYYWWPNIKREIAKYVVKYRIC